MVLLAILTGARYVPLSTGTIEAQLYDHAHRLLKTHETLLRDAMRNRAFYEALKRNVKSGSVVLDIGSGVGIWAIAAAKLGAKRVVAVDMDELLTGVCKTLAVEHGVADLVEAIWGNSLEIGLEREFDVVISETIGYLGYDENVVAIMRDARQRFLKKDGVLIPETVSLYAAAGHLKVRQDTVPVGIPFGLAALQRLNLHSPKVLKKASDIKLLTKPVRLVETDLRKAATQPSLENLRAGWDIDDPSQVNCFAVWVESRLTKGVRLSTRRTTSWLPNIYRVDPVEGEFSHLDLELSLTAASNYWTATFSNNGESITQRYSPEFAAVEMIAASRGLPVEVRDGRVVLNKNIGQISLRPAVETHKEFQYAVYAAGRSDEVAAFGWDEEQLNSFLRMQFQMRQRSYQMQYPAAEYSVILFGEESAGSLIVDRTDAHISLTNIAVLPQYRKHGIATHVIRQIQIEAVEAGKPLVLQVDKANGAAKMLYDKLGFMPVGESEFAYAMQWAAEPE